MEPASRPGALAVTATAAASPLSFTRLARAAGTADGAIPDSFALPDTERRRVTKAWLTGGRATKAAAAVALTGTAADISAFLADQLPTLVAEDNRVALFTYIARAGIGMRRDGVTALDSGDSAISAFVSGGYQSALTEDLQVATATVMSNGGTGVNREGTAALDAGTMQALTDFLNDGQYPAREEDQLLETPEHEHLAFEEGQMTGVLYADRNKVSIIAQRHAMILRRALGPEQSARFIRKVTDEP